MKKMLQFLLILIVASSSLIAQKADPTIQADTIPSDLPYIKMLMNDTTQAYHADMTVSTQSGKQDFIMIYDYMGNLKQWKRTKPSTFNFKLQPNGYFVYSDTRNGNALDAVARVIDKDFKTIDTFLCGNGFPHFPSEFFLMPNGHAIIQGNEARYVNMRDFVPNGDPNAVVLGTVVQELDKDHNVVFQWRSYDHIKDISETYENTSLSNFRYTHSNAVELDRDGNLLISLRHMSQIVKVDRNTGEIIWRLGGKKGDFTFVNEREENKLPSYFVFQHDIRRLTNGNITLFDNGNLRTPARSRAVEYKLDETAKTAELVWQYRYTPDVFATTKGSIEPLPNGNRLICWGGASETGQISTTELNSKDELVMQYSVPNNLGCYRNFKYDLPACQPVATYKKNEVNESNTYNFNDANNNTGIGIKFTTLSSQIPYNYFTVTKYNCSPLNPDFTGEAPLLLTNRVVFSKSDVINSFTGEVSLNLSNYSKNLIIPSPKAYFRPVEGSGKFIALQTDYDKSSNTMTFTIPSVGELVIAQEYTITAPAKTVLVDPANGTIFSNKINSVRFYWNPQGRYDSSHLQVFGDGIKLLDTTTKNTFMTIPFNPALLSTIKQFKWNVTATNSAGTSPASDDYTFTISDPYTSLIFPNGGDTLRKDSTFYVIKWNDNMDDSVRVELLQEDSVALTIASSVYSPLNNIQWMVPSKIGENDNYKIRVTSKSIGTIKTVSQKNFSIRAKVNSVDDNLKIKNEYAISVYPNPVKNIFGIDLDSKSSQNLNVSLYDEAGNNIKVFTEKINDGNNHLEIDISELNTGIYFLKINLKEGSYTEKIIKK